MSASTSFFTSSTLEAEQASTLIWKKRRKSIGVLEGQSQASTITLHHVSPTDLDAKMVGDFVLDLGVLLTQGESSQLNLHTEHVHPGRG